MIIPDLYLLHGHVSETVPHVVEATHLCNNTTSCDVCHVSFQLIMLHGINTINDLNFKHSLQIPDPTGC